jgi:DNA polymerase-1
MPEDSGMPLLLVDGSSYLYRAYHALPPLTNSRGRPTGAIYGVVNMLRKLLAEYEPDRIAVVFDARGRTFRDDLFTEYKANRSPMPDDLSDQIEPLLGVVRAMGLPLLQVSGVEADDVIGTLARRARERGMETVISTGDKDMAQLVNDHVSLVNTMTGVTLDREGVAEKFGVPPERIVDYLALMGDSTDNIPGIPKVGPKTAAKWLATYGTLDRVIEHANDIGGKVGESLRANLDSLDLSRQLATIHCDVVLEVEPGELRLGKPDTDALRQWYGELEFNRLLAELDAAGTGPPASVDAGGTARDYETILTASQLEGWLARLEAAELFAFDTETTSLDYQAASVVGVSFAVRAGEAAYVPLAHDYPGAPSQLDRDMVLARLRPLLTDPLRAKVGHNLKYDRNVLANHGISLEGIHYDTMLESYVLDSTATRHDMDSVALKYLNHHTIRYADVAGKGARQLDFNQVPVERASPYAAEDADITLRLHQVMWPMLTRSPELEHVYQEIEMPLVPVLSDMERRGVCVDTDMLARQSEELAGTMRELEAQAIRLAGQVVNLDSPTQIREVLYNRLGLPVLAKTPKGVPSTAESVLQELALDYPLPRLILEYRSCSKLKSTYTDRLPEQVDRNTGRIHTSYHQAVAATGRLSSSDPNLQNIPVRTEMGRRIRKAFIAPSGKQILAADYSQIELRIMAHLSGDEGLLRAFEEGEDIHRATAAEVFGVGPEQVTPDQRRSAKAINFGLIYGMSAYGLARQLGIKQPAAQEYVNLYFQRYPGVRAYMEATRARAKERGYVQTVFGRRLYLPDINSRNASRRAQAERTAINAPMQGTAADIIKRAMIRLHEWIKRGEHDLQMIMQVHDELVFEVASPDVADLRPSITERMVSAAQLSVPLVVDVGVGNNWDEAHQ